MGTERAPNGEQVIDTSKANEARVYDYLLGGKDHFEIDRETAERQGAAVGGIANAQAAVRSNRRFLGEVVRWLSKAGIRQFLDIGSGLPSENNVHEVAQRYAPESRVFYVDYDPIVMAHAHQLLRGTPEGRTDYRQADFRDPELILDQAADMLDFARPVALLLISFLHFFPDEEHPQQVVADLLDALCPGSYLAMSHLTADMEPEKMTALAEAPGPQADYVFVMRNRAEIERFFAGLVPVRGGVVPLGDWLPPDTPDPQRGGARMYHAGLGIKP